MSGAFLFQCFIIFLGVGLIGALLQLIAPENQIFHQDSSNASYGPDSTDESDDRVERFAPSENVERYVLEQTTDSQKDVNHEHHYHSNEH